MERRYAIVSRTSTEKSQIIFLNFTTLDGMSPRIGAMKGTIGAMNEKE